MIEKLAALNEKYDRLTALVSDPEIIAQQSEWQKHVKARSEIEDVVLAYREYLQLSDRKKKPKNLLKNSRSSPKDLRQKRKPRLKERS